MILKSKKQARKNGFTLMEVLLSTAILSIGMVSSVGLISYNISIISNSINRVVASNLAQDSIEIVRNARDTNWILGRTGDHGAANAWDSGIKGTGNEEYVIFSCVNGSQDKINPDPSGSTEIQKIDDCAANGDCKVYIYTYSGANPPSPRKCFSDNFGASQSDSGGNSYAGVAYADFYRLVHIESINDHSNKVTVTVRWKNRGQNNYLTVEEVLYNWKK